LLAVRTRLSDPFPVPKSRSDYSSLGSVDWKSGMSIIHCIYSSRAIGGFVHADLVRLLEASRTNNAAHGITGILLFVENSFFQVLEGPEGEVDDIYRSIARDVRHDRVTQIIREPIARRDFADWTMGYVSMDLAEVGSLIGENDFFSAATCLERVDQGRARKLLNAFAAGRWRTEDSGEYQIHARIG
jgi:Sensors of blue-light using FAD